MFRYFSGEVDVSGFRDWCMEMYLDKRDDFDKDAKRLVAEIEGSYAEFSDGLVSEAFFQQRLQQIAQGVSQPQSGAILLDAAVMFVALDEEPSTDEPAQGHDRYASSSSDSSPWHLVTIAPV